MFAPKHTIGSVARKLADGLENGMLALPGAEPMSPIPGGPAKSAEDRPQLFLSYAREDRPAARRLYQALCEHTFNVWFDEVSLVAGQNWMAAICNAIRQSNFFLALLSDASVSKHGFVQKEIREALRVIEGVPEGRTSIIPVRLNECQPSYTWLRQLHWIDLFEDWDRGIHEILRATSLEPPRKQERVAGAAFERPLSSFGEELLERAVQPVRVTQILHEAIASFGHYTEVRNIDLALRDESKGAVVTADPDALRLVVCNLLDNAIKYSWRSETTKTWVSVASKVQAETVVIRVENVGTPLARDEIETGRIFQRGYRSRFAHGTVGAGIGLYLAKTLLTRWSGDIVVDSKPMRGRLGPVHYDEPFFTTFEIRLHMGTYTDEPDEESEKAGTT